MYWKLTMNTCPCQRLVDSTINYASCCQPFHLGTQLPKTAEQLMRSRYSAFALSEERHVKYIIETTLPAQQALLDIDEIANWAKETDWAGLEIIQHIPKVNKRHSKVEFKAYFNTTHGKQAHHELSAFVKVTNAKEKQPRWYFIDPTQQISLTQKQPCLCGSSEKFKRCCGLFLS